MVLFGESDCICTKNVCIRVKWLYSGKSVCIRENMVVFVKNMYCADKVDVFGQSLCIRARWLYSG